MYRFKVLCIDVIIFIYKKKKNYFVQQRRNIHFVVKYFDVKQNKNNSKTADKHNNVLKKQNIYCYYYNSYVL